MAALLAGIPAGILSAFIAWLLGAGWLGVLAAYGLGGTFSCLGIAALNWFLRSGKMAAGCPAVGKQGPHLARAPMAGAKQFREP